MVSFLDPSQLRAKIANGFRGKLLIGTLTRNSSGGFDDNGREIAIAPETFLVQGLCDEYSDEYKARAGIPEGTVKLILIAGLCETEPQKNDLVSFANFPLFQINKVKTDPARAHFECQSSEV